MGERAAYLVEGGRALTMERNSQGQLDILSGLIRQPWDHVFLLTDDPEYRGALVRILTGQDLRNERVKVRLVLEGRTILVKPSAIMRGSRAHVSFPGRS